MYDTPDVTQIKQLKKVLNQHLLENNFDLLAPDVLDISRKLDDFMLPIFESHLAFYNYLLKYQLTPR